MSDPFALITTGKASAKAPAVSLWQAVTPVPADAPAPPDQHPKMGKPAGHWTYRDASGGLLGFVNRFDVDGGKAFRPLVLHRHATTGKLEWRWESWPAPRPLYGLDRLAASPAAPVVLRQGEKAVDAAARLCLDLGGYHFAER